MSESQGDASGKADCPACKLIGAGGCFAGAWYALFERARLPANNRNRHWLGAIAIGESDVLLSKWVMIVTATRILFFFPMQLQ